MIYHRSLYQSRVRFFKHEKYHILTSELYHSVKSFDEKLNICETCHKHFYKNETPCQVVCNRIKNELEDLKKSTKIPNFQENFI